MKVCFAAVRNIGKERFGLQPRPLDAKRATGHCLPDPDQSVQGASEVQQSQPDHASIGRPAPLIHSRLTFARCRKHSTALNLVALTEPLTNQLAVKRDCSCENVLGLIRTVSGTTGRHHACVKRIKTQFFTIQRASMIFMVNSLPEG